MVNSFLQTRLTSVDVNLPALLRGELPAPAPTARVFALPILTGQRHELTPHDLELLSSVPAGRWIEADGHDPEALRLLAENEVHDLTVEDPPIEDVIEQVFAS